MSELRRGELVGDHLGGYLTALGPPLMDLLFFASEHPWRIYRRPTRTGARKTTIESRCFNSDRTDLESGERRAKTGNHLRKTLER